MWRSAAPVTKSHPPTSPNAAPATQNECHQWSATHMKRHFQCAEQSKAPCNLTKLLRLPRKMQVSNDLRHIWNVICNARSNSTHLPTSPKAAPATENDTHDWSCVTYETSFPMRGAGTALTLQPHHILRLPRKMASQNMKKIYVTRYEASFTKRVRPWSEDQNCNPPRGPNTFLPRHAFAILYCVKLQHFALQAIYPNSPNMRLPRKAWRLRSPKVLPRTVTSANHQIRFEEKWHSNITTICRPADDIRPLQCRPKNRHLAPAASGTFPCPILETIAVL